jgi:TPP-dependent pyruvate/acetoin dehydrogenase alpha subunit
MAGARAGCLPALLDDDVERVMPLSNERMLSLLRTMLLMRRTEEAVCDLADEFPGNFHVYIGQEATGACVLSTLRPDDPVFTTHRNHAHNVARGMPPAQILSEILGRATGSSRGKGGTFHVMSQQYHTAATAIVGGSTILATGAGLAAQVLGDDRIGVAFLGDRTLNEGAVYEAFNIASLWKLPVLYVCEYNNAAPYNPAASGLSVAAIPEIARTFRIETESVDATDPLALLDAVENAIKRVRTERIPLFLETRTPRWPGNAGQDPSLDITGRTDLSLAWAPPAKDVHEAWHATDPVLRLVKAGLQSGSIDQSAAEQLDAEVGKIIAEAMAAARSAPAPTPSDALVDALSGSDLWPPVGGTRWFK